VVSARLALGGAHAIRREQAAEARLPIVFILNGPNLNLLGVREPATYGYDTLGDVEQRCLARANALDLQIDFRQTNHEGQMVDWIQEARESADGIILNAGALTHTSVAVLDALNAAELPIIEVHLSNIFRRESFRHHSYVSLAANGGIFGLGPQGYELALEAMAALIEDRAGEGPQ
jgi:3-dehydroquinate dehydratase II